MTTTPEPEIVPGTSRPIPADPGTEPRVDPDSQPDTDPQPL